MKTLFFKLRYLIVCSMVLGLLITVSCEKEETPIESIESVDTVNDIQEKRFSTPDDPDFRPPRIPQPPQFDAVCVVRLAYLSYLRRCPENQSVVNGWVSVLLTRGFDDLAAGFITSHEANVKWNSQYHSFLSRNHLTSHQVDKQVYIAYRGLLLREPDVNGGIGWTHNLRQFGIKFVANGIANSQEFANRLANIATECTNAANQCTY
ncbi:hypothetical protein [Aquimarina sp. 2201CG14-23]|uniref:hypothetical protein n=1 Tax=Aquimarina mycalae TaxID=3040073 RepID=UPI002477E6D9|nr:hypothetical protein [Aquimarina sp. 2201CG14-23]MDH7444151.1 hypothetical protein [Aquimarina sp. 2201CG14-23]